MTNKTAGQPESSGVEATLSALGPIEELLGEVRTYPVALLRRICDLYAAREASVPDYALHLTPYLGETTLRALIEGGYVELEAQTHMAVHAYIPTPSGIALMGGEAPAKRAASKPSVPKKVKA